MSRVLIIEDEAALATALGMLVERMGHVAIKAPSAALGLAAFADEAPDLILLDIGLPDESGIEVLARIRSESPELPVLVITAHGSLQNAVEAKKRGATDYLVKPLDLAELESSIRALLESEVADAPGELPEVPDHAPVLIGSAPAMQPAFAAIAHACVSDAPVLITGPTGIGKSLTAQVIHRHSARHTGPFVTLSCASLPEALLEAELFGHERGAFTGAQATRTGHFERAAGGTLFLDEIAEIPPALQVKLLRAVEDKTFVRVGGREDRRVDLRIIAASNQDLDKAVREKRFREDLLFRLRVLEVPLPPLAERASDLPALSAYILANLHPERRLSISAEAMAALTRYPWPGNVRELRNVLEHAAAVCTGSVMLEIHLPEALRGDLSNRNELPTTGAAAKEVALDHALRAWLDQKLGDAPDYNTLQGELEGKLLRALLPRFEDKPTLLARELHMNRATLRRKLKDLDGD